MKTSVIDALTDQILNSTTESADATQDILSMELNVFLTIPMATTLPVTAIADLTSILNRRNVYHVPVVVFHAATATNVTVVHLDSHSIQNLAYVMKIAVMEKDILWNVMTETIKTETDVQQVARSSQNTLAEEDLPQLQTTAFCTIPQI